MSSTLYFNELSIQNFLSFGNAPTIIVLNEPGTVSIEGQNLDSGGSNGAGKTTIINAICYALYNKPFDNISLQRLINSTNATKNTMMEVRLSFERAGDEYEIVRTRGETYSIKLYKNGDDITPGKSVTECDAMIQEVIGISYELFTKTIIFSGNAQAFLQLPVSQQRGQIEELFNITLLSEKAKKEKDKIREAEADLKVQEAVVKQQEVALELQQTHLKQAEARCVKWEDDRQRSIRDIEATLITVGQVDFELEQELHDEKTKLTQQGISITSSVNSLLKDQRNLTNSVDKLFGEQKHLRDAKCPYCSQAFADAPTRLKQIDIDLEREGTMLLEVEETLAADKLRLGENQTRMKEVQALIQHPNLSQLIAARENVSVSQARLAELKIADNPHFEAYDRLAAEKEVIVDNEKVDQLRRRIEHMHFLLKLLVNKDSFLRRRIINKNIPFLNERINSYTRKLGLPHIVKFDADMSCTVSEFGRELDFGNLSQGEKKRVNTALALAFRDVLHHLHAKSNLLLIDELDGALDSGGIDAVVRILKEKARDEEMGIYIISHHPNVAGRLERTLTVSKQHGFSTIIED